MAGGQLRISRLSLSSRTLARLLAVGE